MMTAAETMTAAAALSPSTGIRVTRGGDPFDRDDTGGGGADEQDIPVSLLARARPSIKLLDLSSVCVHSLE